MPGLFVSRRTFGPVTVLSFSFGIMLVAKDGQALRLSSYYGVGSLLSPSTFGISKHGLSPIYNAFEYRSKRSIATFTSVYLSVPSL
jgi:hypothetical protein